MNDLTLDDLYAGSPTPATSEAYLRPKIGSDMGTNLGIIYENIQQIQEGMKKVSDPRALADLRTNLADYRRQRERFTTDGEPAVKQKEAKQMKGGTLSLDDLYEPVHQTDAQIQSGALKAYGLAFAGELAPLGDLVLSAPGAISGSLGELFLRADLSRDKSIGQRGAASAGREFREYITQKGSPTWFSDIVKQFTPPGEAPQETTVARALGWLEKKIDAGGEIVDKATGGKINKDDVSGFVNGAMNALGLKATMGIGKGKGKAGEPSPEKEKIDPTLDPESVLTPEGEPAPKPATKAKLKELQAQVRKKYTDDAEFAQHYAKQANAQAEAIQTAKAAEERLKNPPPSTDPIILTPEAKVDTGTIGQRSLDTGLDKVVKGKKFDLTAEERIALKGAGVRGKADLALLSLIAVGGTGLALANAYPDAAEKMGGALLAGGMIAGKGKGELTMDALQEGRTLGAILKDSPYTLKTLENLPQNRTSFPKKMVEEQLKREGVTKAEKDVLGAVLAEHPGEEISSAALMQGVKKATGDFELKEKASSEYADYGLENIDRNTYDQRDLDEEADMTPAEVLAAAQGEVPAKTSIWQLPEHMPMSSANHFQDPLYFGHTRSFVEGGVKHVVEVQSDLAQHSRELSPEQIKTTSEELIRMETKGTLINNLLGHEEKLPEILIKLKELDPNIENELHEALQREKRTTLNDGLTGLEDARKQAARELRGAVFKMYAQARQTVSELQARLGSAGRATKVSPMLKNWDKRLVREELAASARNGEPVTRFATAGTVAKVEGWPERSPPTKETLEGVVEYSKRIVREREEDLVAAGRPHVTADAEAYAKDQLAKAKHDLEIAEYQLKTVGEPKPRFSPQHQGIYNRYKGDVEKFLRQLGGKEVTDSAGHTWIETPTGVDRVSGKRVQMFGGAKLDMLKGIAAVGLGLAVGANLDPENPIEGAVLGVIGGAAAVTGAVPKLYRTLKEVVKPDNRIRINDLTEKHELDLKRVARDVYQVQNKIWTLVPSPERRAAINTLVDEGKIATLVGKEKEAAHIGQEFYSRMADLGLDAKVLKDIRDNYTTHLWDKVDKAKLDAIVQARGGPSMSPNSRFANARSHVTMAEGKAAGLKPVTEDIAEIIGMYGNSLGRSIANKNLIEGLKSAKTGEGQYLVRPISKAPLNYVTINSPHLQQLRVHPDIAPSLKFMFEAQDPGAVMGALEAVNTALKRNAVSFSLFHAKALADAALGAVKNPLTVGKMVAQAALPKVFGQSKYLQQLKEGGAGDLIDHAFKDGLMFSFERAESAVEDVGGGFYKGMKSIQNTLDAAIPKSGTVTVGSYIRVNHALDNFMWGRLHAGMKLEVYAAKVEALMESSAKRGKALTRDEAGKIAASYTNDVFGGLNWQRIAEGARTKFGRDLALSALSPKGRRGLQLLMFAPDWTLSTVRAFTQSFGKGSGVKGLFSSTTLADLHRQQLIRSAFYYATIGDAVNYYNTGHHIWDNKDWTRVELGDGRTMQLSKHFAEPFHWMMQPGQQALNKLGVLPKEGMEQALGVKYLSAKGRMPPMDTSAAGRLKHAAGSTLPIGVQQFQQGGAAAGAAGMLGVPIYGQTPEQKRQARFEASLARFRKHQQELEDKK